jgi:hypothetical protein
MGRNKRPRRRNHMNNTVVVGIDLGERESVASILSPAGEVIRTFSFAMGEKGYKSFEDVVPKEARLAFEATGVAYLAWRTFGELGYDDITVAHPIELAWICQITKKERLDSLKIAKLHLVGMRPESHLLTREEQIRRDLLIQRVKLGVEIGKLKSVPMHHFPVVAFAAKLLRYTQIHQYWLRFPVHASFPRINPTRYAMPSLATICSISKSK